MDERTIGIISIFAGALPAIAGIIIFYKAGFKHRLLVLFLVLAFLCDLVKLILFDNGYVFAAKSIFYSFSLAEPVFFCWFIYKSCDYIPVSKTALILAFVLPIFWVITHFDITGLTWRTKVSGALFNTVYGMVLSLLASFCILRLTQRNESLLSIPDFWFLGAMFFYFFNTFFVKSFLQTTFMDKSWFIHDLFNIMACFIYTFGFFRIETKKVS